jgi:hypothetical protein
MGDAQAEVLLESLDHLQVPRSHRVTYWRILNAGTMPESAILETSEDPTSVRWLEAEGFVFRDVDQNNRTRYYPCEPGLLAQSLLNKCSWKYGEFSAIPSEELEKVRGHIEAVRSVAQDVFQKMVVARRLPKGIVYLEGPERISNFIVSMISDASDIFGVTAAEWTSNLPLIWAAICDRLAKGIRYRRIVGEVTLTAFGHAINKRDVNEIGVQLRVLPQSLLTSPFYLIETPSAESAIAFNDVQLRRERRIEAHFIDHGRLVASFRDRATELWNMSAPAASVFDFLDGVRGEYLRAVKDDLGSYAEDLASQVFDWGIFCDFPPDPRSLCVIEQLSVAKHILPYNVPIGRFPYMANILEPLRSFLAASLQSKEISRADS